MQAFIDFGSSCNLIRETEARKIGTAIDESCNTSIKGYGSGHVVTLGKVTLPVEVDNVRKTIELLVVPDRLQDVPLLIGQPFTEQSDILVIKTNNKLQFSIKPNEVLKPKSPDKIALWLIESVNIPPNHVANVEVYSKKEFEGNLMIDSTLRCQPGKEYGIPRVLIQLGAGSNPIVPIMNLSGKDLVLSNKNPLVRAFPCEASLDGTEASVLYLRNQENVVQRKPLDEAKINIGTDDSVIKEKLMIMLQQYRECFAENIEELGVAKSVEIEIKLHDNVPFRYRPYRMAESEKTKVREIVAELLGAGIIQESDSPYASPVLLVKKKNGQDRMCIDFRKLNLKTIKNRYPLPRIDDQIDKLKNCTVFTTLDLSSGYHQIKVADDSKHLTAFVTPEGHYEYNRMPFGLCNAPAVFQRLVNKIFEPCRDIAAVYLDDIVIPSKTVQDNMLQLEKIFKILQTEGLTLNCKKCFFLYSHINYLGFEIDKNGLKPGGAKIEAIRQFPIPKTVRNIRQFIGLTGYFRKFIRDYASIVRPLTALTRKNAAWQWGEKENQAFEALKELLIQRPILAIYDPTSPTEVHTDASQDGVAGILLQKQDNKLLPVAYYSRHTNRAESKYHSFELETLAVVESLQKFRVYLLGKEFKVVTDCNALRTAQSKRDIIPRIARWWLQLLEFNFTVEYRPGKRMLHVDALSRNACNNAPSEETVLKIQEADWILSAQLSDEKIKLIHEILTKPPVTDYEKGVHRNFALRNNRVYRISARGIQWVVPRGFRNQVVRWAHDNSGHFAVEKTLDVISNKYWFPRMKDYIEKYIANCIPCLYHKIPSGRREGYLHPIAKEPVPFHTVHLDHLGPFQRTKVGNQYLIVLVDAFTKYVCMKALKTTKTSPVIKFLEATFNVFGVPTRIISDRASAFTSREFKAFCKKNNIHLVLNAVATPRANGQVERMNRTIRSALATSTETEDSWDKCVDNIQFAINNTIHQIINKSPHQVLMGYRPRPKCDSILASEVVIQQVAEDIEKLREEVSRKINVNQLKSKTIFDRRRKSSRNYRIGELVLIRSNIKGGEGLSQKLASKYVGPMVVCEILPNDRYRVADMPGAKRSATVKYDNVVAVDRMRPYGTPGGAVDTTDEDSGSDGVS